MTMGDTREDDAKNYDSAPSDPDAHARNDTIQSNKTPDQWFKKLKPQNAPGQAPLIGARLGNYEVLSLLGEGGFGTVYRGRDVKLGRDVALKFLHNPLEERHQELFEREAKAIAALGKHPSIVQIFAWGEYEGLSYFALEYVEFNAEALLDKAPEGIPLERALRIVVDCAEALSQAHEEGIYHRDIKPANILIEASDDRAKLADFGLARFVNSGKATVSGIVCGSPCYMSPEQARAEKLDGRTDIYSLGVTLYELLCGQLPYEGSSQIEVMANVLENNRVALDKRRPDLPPAVAATVETACAYAPEDRFQTAADFATHLHALLDAVEKEQPLPVAILSQRKAGGRTRRAVLACVVAVIVTVLGATLVGNFGTGGESVTGGVALALANDSLERDDLAMAVTKYNEALEESPVEASYGLGYALLRQNKVDEAQARFEMIDDDVLREEGMVAVAYAKRHEGSRTELEAAADLGATPYPAVLLGSLDAALSRDDKIVARLDKLTDRLDELNFVWQRTQFRQTLGQAHYHLGNLEKAMALFDAIGTGDSEVPEGAASLAGAFAELSRRKANEEQREANRKKIQALGERLTRESYQVASKKEKWTSRPLRFMVGPPEAGTSRLARESGLTDALPIWIERDLPKRTHLRPLDRENIAFTLSEQELSNFLGAEDSQLQLRQVLTARLMIHCSFRKVFDDETLTVKLMDTETTSSIVLEELDLVRPFDRQRFMDDLIVSIDRSVNEHYPLQGVLDSGGGNPAINLGVNVQVVAGMRFVVLQSGSRSTKAISDWRIEVQEPIGVDSAAVQLVGFSVDNMPTDALYVIEESWYDRHGAGATTSEEAHPADAI